MGEQPGNDKVFPFQMATWLQGCYAAYLRWLRGLLERLGREPALAVWEEAVAGEDDGLLSQILSGGWRHAPSVETGEIETSIVALTVKNFPLSIEGLDSELARQWVEKMPPIQQIKQTLPELNVIKEVTAEEALHLRLHGIALLCEALICRHGKQGELIAYDLLRQGRVLVGGGKTGSVAEFIADFIAEPEEANLFTIGLKTKLVRVSDREVVLHVRQCAWARYFQKRHPLVGYLVACSTDEADYLAFNENLRMQRTSTLMEGGEVCDFRIYLPDTAPLPLPGGCRLRGWRGAGGTSGGRRPGFRILPGQRRSPRLIR